MNRKALFLLSMLGAASGGQNAFAQQPPQDFWIYPVIQGYGKIHPLPHAAYRPDANKTYKIIFLITKASKTPDTVNSGLDHVARTVNLYGNSGVRKENLKIVAVISGEATMVTLNNEAYRKLTGQDNPNLQLIAALHRAGVDVTVCGQAIPEHHYDYNDILPDVTLSLSALTTVTTLENQGYALLQF